MNKTSRPLGWLAFPCRVILGGLFVFAGTVKLMNPQLFQQSISAFKVGAPDHLVVLATFSLPWTELLVGVALILGLWTRAASALLSLILIAFVALLSSVLIRKMDVSCSCFGKFEVPCPSKVGACQLIRNAVLLTMTGIVFFFGPGPLAIDRESTK